ncbi:MAG TPA: fimbrillin family protein [Candidatus Phocaeicola excrementigallinarum]|nr:fimbrillin family protein [Candidatus Phocaeicola excrementigallinarum]
MYGLVAALLLSACSQDEPTEYSTTLPEGEYPLQIGSVSLTAEVNEQPWTRVSENPTDGMSSVWKDGDKIGVRIGDNEETGIYVMNVEAEGRVVGVTPEKAVYWKDKQPATITAWYPLNEELDFTHQDQGLTYLLKATGDGNYQSTPINLNFTHQLAKVRVELTGTKSNEVQQVYVRSYPTSTHSHGTLDSQDKSLTPQYVPMRRATYGGVEYWEANLRKGYLDADNTFRVSSDGKNFVQAKLTTDVDITPGHVHTIKIDVGEAQQVEGNISDNGPI